MGDKLAANDVEALIDYRNAAPFAARNHPTDEHLLPLYVAMGGGGGRGQGEPSSMTAPSSACWR